MPTVGSGCHWGSASVAVMPITSVSSLQGALQLRQDFELVRELVVSERYGLAPETRQALLALRVFQQMDGAILCLLQQPGGAAGGTPRPWHNLRRCCEKGWEQWGWDDGRALVWGWGGRWHQGWGWVQE